MALIPGRGTTPAGAASEVDASRYVRAMFGRIAPRYDLANHLLSGNLDRGWRSRTVRAVRAVSRRPGAVCLDLCCGTGDLLVALRAGTPETVIGSDFCRPMLAEAADKLRDRGLRAPLIEADALRLPLPDASVDLITCAFGFRNFTNYEAGARELRRVLRANGLLAILECAEPQSRLWGGFYRWYAKRVLPSLGGAVSGELDAYNYLPDSVSKYPKPAEISEMLREAGFASVTSELMTFGVTSLHLAHVSQGRTA